MLARAEAVLCTIPPDADGDPALRLLRGIADVHQAPVPMLADRDTPPLDMSQGELRSVSPIHIEYLQNMGVGASLSVSIVVQGRLWGLLACHHMGPLRLAYPVLRRSRFLVGTFNEALGVKDVTWLAPDGNEMTTEHWHDAHNRCLGMLLDGRAQETGIRRKEGVVPVRKCAVP